MQRALVFANGDLPADTPAAWRPGDWVLAADGGARHCLALGLTPAVVVGDLDSLEPEVRERLERAGTVFEPHPTDKDATDLELALLRAAGAGAEYIGVLGALGGRLDMTVANLMLLAHPALAGRRVEFWHGRQKAWLLSPPGGPVTGQPGDTFSLIPLGGAVEGVQTSGLRYALHAEPLAFGPARGVSNSLTQPDARVDLTAGRLLAVLTAGPA